MTATTAETSAAPPRHPQRWLILGVICLAQLTVLLDNTVLSVAIPSLTRELDASTSDIQWMINAYSLVQSGLLLTAGSSADRYGRKKMLMAGLALFGAGSLVAAFAQSSAQLIAARAGMGVGGALLMTTTLAVVVQIFDDSERVKAIGIWSTVSSLGFAAGPLLGGFMLNHFWWGSIFLINLPVALLGLAAVAKLVPESKNPRGDRPDLLGALLSTIGMTSVVYAIISGPEHGWTSAQVLVSAAVGVAGPRRLRALGAAHPVPDAGHALLPQPAVRRRGRGRDPGRVRAQRFALPADPAPPVRPRVRAPGGGAADGAARGDHRGAEPDGRRRPSRIPLPVSIEADRMTASTRDFSTSSAISTRPPNSRNRPCTLVIPRCCATAATVEWAGSTVHGPGGGSSVPPCRARTTLPTSARPLAVTSAVEATGA
ncbi:Putative multidrug resistance protein MdtD [Streptomyces alboniger]